MRHRVLSLIAGLVLALSVGVVAAQPEEYDGASFCADAKAWPNGTYLGQMHPFHVQHYQRFAGAQACTRWAADQQASAVNGLRALGYTVVAPSAPRPQPPAPVVTPAPPAPTPSATTRTGWIDPTLQPAWEIYVGIMRVIAARDPDGIGAFVDRITVGARIQAVRIVWAPLPADRIGQYVPATHTIEIAERLQTESLAVQAAILTHETVHAMGAAPENREQCVGWERLAFRMQAGVWSLYGYPAAATPLERGLTNLVHTIDTPTFTTWLEEHYAHHCAAYA